MTQWTFVHPTDELLFRQRMNSAIDSRPGDITTSRREKESLSDIRLANNKREDDASTDVSEISDDEYDGDENKVHSRSEHSRYNHRVIRDFSDSSDDEYVDTEHDVHREKESTSRQQNSNFKLLKPGKLKKNGSICSEKSATVKMNPLMSKCQCGCSETG